MPIPSLKTTNTHDNITCMYNEKLFYYHMYISTDLYITVIGLSLFDMFGNFQNVIIQLKYCITTCKGTEPLAVVNGESGSLQACCHQYTLKYTCRLHTMYSLYI